MNIKFTKVLGVLCLMNVAGLLFFGLWPFHSPRNQVTWLSEGKGMAFGRHGTILSSGAFKAQNIPLHSPCSLEIWFEPRFTDGGGALFNFYSRGRSRQLSLRQSGRDLALRIDIENRPFRPRITGLYVPDLFRQGKSQFVTVTSNGEQASIYVNGALARPPSPYPLSAQDFEGQLILGDSPVDINSWSGIIRGLAFFDQELSPEQVLHDYSTWKTRGRPDPSESERALALYLFDEKTGTVIHSRAGQGPDLIIPSRLLVVDQVYLQSPLKAFQPTRGYLNDVLINIGGFIPFGFLVCAYFSLAGRIKRPGLATIVLGFAISFAIESIQSHLPTRDSDITDVITNTLGTILGVGLYRMQIWRTLLAGIGARYADRIIGAH